MAQADWEAQYMQYTAQQESPSAFHRWVAIATVGLALGRKLWFSRQGVKALFPGQIMVVLVAASGVMRKTTAVEQGKRLLQALGERVPRSVNILPDRASPQKLIYRLQPRDREGEVIKEADCNACIISGEMGAYFSQEGYLETLATHVTALNDAPHGPWDKVARRFGDAYYKLDFMEAGETKLLNPCIGMLTATTPTGLATELPETARAGGFLGRSLLVYADRSDRTSNPMIDPDPPPGSDTFGELLDGLVWMVKNLEGLVRLTPPAAEEYAKWYDRYHASQAGRNREVSSVAAWTGYISRKTDHVLRVAMILAAMTQAAQGGKKPVLWIYPNHVKYSIQLLGSLEQHFDRAMAYFDRQGRAGLQGKLLKLLARPSRVRIPTSRFRLVKEMNYLGYSAAQVDEALRQLSQCEEVEQSIGRRPTRYGGTKEEYFFRYLPTRGYIRRFTEESSDEVLGEEPPEPDEDDDLRVTNNLGTNSNGKHGGKWPQESSDAYQPSEPWEGTS